MWLLVAMACSVTEEPGTHGPEWIKEPPPRPPGDDSVTDVFTQPSRPNELDVLVAIDPDPALWAAFDEVLPGLLASFDGVDPRWQVAFTSTSLPSPEIGWLAPTGADGGRWLSREDLLDPSVDWTDAPVAEPFGGSGATYLAIDTDRYGFRRPEAALQLIIVSRVPDATPESVIPFHDWTEWVGGEDAVVFAAVPAGEPLLDVVDVTGGVAGDPEASLDPWSSLVAVRSQNPVWTYPLSAIPLQETIDLTVQDFDTGVTFFFQQAVGDPPVGDYAFDGSSNTIRFLEYVPESLALVIAHYVPRRDVDVTRP